MSLNINGKKNKLTKNDFDILGSSLQLNEKQIKNCYKSFADNFDKILWWIDSSFLPIEHKGLLKKIVSIRIDLLNPK